MTIVATTLVHPNPGVAWGDIHKQLKRASDLATKHGAENITVMVSMVGGARTNTIGFLTTAKDWVTYGRIQQGLSVDPDYASLLADSSQLATWENYVNQTIDV